ncbi:hypothetical protein PM8797T_21088 [Gimesia maris DSM 8797]|nr:hypothetical protein PM8797T_21088 [Gimesia maris DSM 8797]
MLISFQLFRFFRWWHFICFDEITISFAFD